MRATRGHHLTAMDGTQILQDLMIRLTFRLKDPRPEQQPARRGLIVKAIRNGDRPIAMNLMVLINS